MEKKKKKKKTFERLFRGTKLDTIRELETPWVSAVEAVRRLAVADSSCSSVLCMVARAGFDVHNN